MNFGALKTLIDSAPANAGLSDVDVAAWCNALSVTRQIEFMFTVRTAMSSLGPVLADSVLTKLEAAATQNQILERTLNMMQPSEGGIDLGHPATRAQIDALVLGSVLTQVEADALKELGTELISPALNAGLGEIAKEHIAHARLI